HVDVRVIATTNRNLEEEIAQQRFRCDLYYRINAVQLSLPPLRDRREDIPPLAQHFFDQSRGETTVDLKGISTQTMELLKSCSWPGNVRQLRNVIHRACVMASGPEIQTGDLPPLESRGAPEKGNVNTLADLERQMILNTLRELAGNKSATAERLGITTR